MKVSDFVRETTTSGDVGTLITPILKGDEKDKKKKKKCVSEDAVEEWTTYQDTGDVDGKWIVSDGGKRHKGHWRTVRGHRVFYKDGGGTIPGKPKVFGKKKTVLGRIKKAISGLKKKKSAKRKAVREVLEDVAMPIVSDLLDMAEASTKKSVNRQAVALLAADMMDSPKVKRRLERMGMDASSFVDALIPVITRGLMMQGVKVGGSSQAKRSLKAMAKE